jgi:hypothetical protein
MAKVVAPEPSSSALHHSTNSWQALIASPRPTSTNSQPPGRWRRAPQNLARDDRRHEALHEMPGAIEALRVRSSARAQKPAGTRGRCVTAYLDVSASAMIAPMASGVSGSVAA